MDYVGLEKALRYREKPDYDPAADGPEISYICFFGLFPDGANSRQLKILRKILKRVCEAVLNKSFGGR